MLDLRPVTDVVATAIRASGLATANDVENCLYVSARHVRAAQWASSLETRWRANEADGGDSLLELEHDVLITATPTLVFASVVTALDLCVAGAAFWCAPTTPTKKSGTWYATGDFFDRKTGARRTDPPLAMPAWFESWFDDLIADPEWTATRPYRDHQIHRIQPRSVSVTVPAVRAGVRGATTDPPSAATSVEQFGPTLESDNRTVQGDYDAVVAFAVKHWTAFWQSLAADA